MNFPSADPSFFLPPPSLSGEVMKAYIPWGSSSPLSRLVNTPLALAAWTQR